MKQKIIALLLALAAAVSLTACGEAGDSSITEGETSSDSVSSEAEDGSSLESEEAAILAAVPNEAREDCVAYLTDGTMTNDTVVMTLDGTDITADMLIYFLGYYETYYMSMFSAYGYDIELEDSYSDDMTYIDFFLQIAENAAVQMTAARVLAESAGVTFSEENQTSLNESIASIVESDVLYVGANSEVMEELFARTIYGNAYQEMVYGEGGEEEITDEATEDYADENGYYNCRYILFYGLDDDGNALEDEALEAVQAEAEECYQSLSQLSGDALVEAFQTQQEELNYDGNTEEFYVTPSSSLVDGFSDAVLSLEEYQVGMSDATSYGYFVVLRLPLGDENLDSVKEDYASSLFSAAISDAISAAEITYEDVLDEVDYAAFFEKLAALQEIIDSAA
ncbi:MAG: hypothetical protein LUG55_02500 [Clostridiales bacterium]|nr:hypothetical protein [Clostridiales bacterium]